MANNKLGIVLFIGSESIFFGLLILAYLYFQGVAASNGGPTAASSLNPLVTGFFSLFLFSSSYTVWRADQNFARQNRSKLQIWLLATIGLGLVFLLGQSIEWRQLILDQTTISRNLFGTTFFTLTGFHGFHVIVGLIALTILVILVRMGEFKGPTSSGFTAISYYWHFVDAVWVVIYSIIYLRLLL